MKYLYSILLLLSFIQKYNAQNPDESEVIPTNVYSEIANNNAVVFSNDTFHLNSSIYYLNKFFNFKLNEDSLITLSDTIIQRESNLNVIDTTTGKILKNCKQIIKFNWKKDIPLNEELITPFTVAAKTSSGRWDDCITYQYYYGISMVCYAIQVCDLPNDDTYNWCSGVRYTKIFQDNFNGTKLDDTYWKIGYDWGREVNAEDNGWALNRNVEVSNGTLKLKTQPESDPFSDDYTNVDQAGVPKVYSGKNFSSGSLTSEFSYGYGKYEIRAKIPASVGVSPTYWINNGDLEIDGFEFFTMNRADCPQMTIFSNNNTNLIGGPCYYTDIHGNPHYFGYNGKNTIFRQTAHKNNIWNTLPNLADGNWYIFTLVYDPNYIKWWVETDDHSSIWGLIYYNVIQQNQANADPNANCSCTGCVVQVNPNFPYNNQGNVKFMMGISSTTSKDFTNGNEIQTGPNPGTSSTFEVDWVKIYVPDDCWHDVTEASGKFRAIDHLNRNHVTGNNITLGGNGDVTPNSEYSIHFQYWSSTDPENTSPRTNGAARANNELALLDGFRVEEGALFEGTIAFDGLGIYNSDCNTLNSWPQYARTSNNTKQDSILNNKEITNTSLYPNPSNDFISIKSQNKIKKIEFYNSVGQLVLYETVNFEKININQLQDGIYFVKTYFEDRETMTKFIKQNKP